MQLAARPKKTFSHEEAAMAITVQKLLRSFAYNGISLPDPGAELSPEQVRDVYSATYPEITTASIEGPEQKGDRLVYTFRRAVGTKGAASRNRSGVVACRREDGLTYIELRPAGIAADNFLENAIIRFFRGVGRLIRRAVREG
jgi:PRTRC genetic system protein C